MPLPPAGTTVLVAVNGQIGGESRLFAARPGDPAAKFAVITPACSGSTADPQLQVYLVDRTGGRPHLRPVTLTSE
jgi:hypothetical protein